MKLRTKIANRFRHPIHVDQLYRARCECGWRGPVREWQIDADEDCYSHWHATGSAS